MTDLNKLLCVARKVWPEQVWERRRGGVYTFDQDIYDNCTNSDPYVRLEALEPTELGRAQLMDIVFALLDAGKEDLSILKIGSAKIYEASVLLKNGSYRFQEGKTKAEAIINLAAEVL